jgi:hypothetical protein
MSPLTSNSPDRADRFENKVPYRGLQVSVGVNGVSWMVDSEGCMYEAPGYPQQ